MPVFYIIQVISMDIIYNLYGTAKHEQPSLQCLVVTVVNNICRNGLVCMAAGTLCKKNVCNLDQDKMRCLLLRSM